MRNATGMALIALLLFAGGSAAATPEPSPEGGVFMLCPSPSEDATCPLPPGEYVAEMHDAFELAISDPGWQEESAGDFAEGTVVLSRVDAPDQRLVIDTGQTSGILDEAALAALLDGTAALQVGPPSATQVGRASGFQVEFAPTEEIQIYVPGAHKYELNSDHRYRLAALQLPMMQESGIKVILVEAPTDTFEEFLPLADAILQTLLYH